MLSRAMQLFHPAAVFSVLFCTYAGCSGDQALVEVRGSVTYVGEPLKAGIVSLRSKDPKVTLHQPTGLIDENGDYRVHTNYQPGAPPGEYRVVVFATEPTIDTGKVSPGMPKSLIPKKYNDVATTPLGFEVQPGAAKDAYDLRLDAKMP